MFIVCKELSPFLSIFAAVTEDDLLQAEDLGLDLSENDSQEFNNEMTQDLCEDKIETQDVCEDKVETQNLCEDKIEKDTTQSENDNKIIPTSKGALNKVGKDKEKVQVKHLEDSMLDPVTLSWEETKYV